MRGDDHPNDDAPHIGNVIGFQDRPGVFCAPWARRTGHGAPRDL